MGENEHICRRDASRPGGGGSDRLGTRRCAREVTLSAGRFRRLGADRCIMPPMPSEDEQFMRRALALAARGRGAVEPNPMVGAVIVRGGAVIGVIVLGMVRQHQ